MRVFVMSATLSSRGHAMHTELSIASHAGALAVNYQVVQLLLSATSLFFSPISVLWIF